MIIDRQLLGFCDKTVEWLYDRAGIVRVRLVSALLWVETTLWFLSESLAEQMSLTDYVLVAVKTAACAIYPAFDRAQIYTRERHTPTGVTIRVMIVALASPHFALDVASGMNQLSDWMCAADDIMNIITVYFMFTIAPSRPRKRRKTRVGAKDLLWTPRPARASR